MGLGLSKRRTVAPVPCFDTTIQKGEVSRESLMWANNLRTSYVPPIAREIAPARNSKLSSQNDKSIRSNRSLRRGSYQSMHGSNHEFDVRKLIEKLEATSKESL